jgi:hypothetical protein
MQTPVTSESLTGHQGVASAPSPEIPFRTPTRPHENVDNYAASGRHSVQEVKLGDAILVCRLDTRTTKPEFATLHEKEELPDLLDFNIDIEKILDGSDSLPQERPKGRVLKWEVPAYMTAMPPANFVNSSNSTRAAKVIEFRRPGQKPAASEKQIF